MLKPAVARVWEGRTREALAEQYADLYEHGVKIRRIRNGVAEFKTISYWSSRAARPGTPPRAAAVRQTLRRAVQ